MAIQNRARNLYIVNQELVLRPLNIGLRGFFARDDENRGIKAVQQWSPIAERFVRREIKNDD